MSSSQINPTKFLSEVARLGNTELGIYTRLLMVYRRDKKPLPFEVDRLRRLALTFSPEECKALEDVVAEFFLVVTLPDGTMAWQHRSEAPRAVRDAAASQAQLLADAGVPDQVARDWLAVRRAKQLPLTATAMNASSERPKPRG